MPGIYGIYCRNTNTGTDRMKALFVSMEKALLHRENYVQYNIIENNASIGKIGFPNDLWGLKPVWNLDHSMVSFLDGAIFSYSDNCSVQEVENPNEVLIKLMDECEKTGSIDTEGLNGEFNLVICDFKTESLLIANDRWGFRELYFYSDNRVFLFTPEVKALLQYEHFDWQLNEQALSDFFNYGYVLGNRTFFDKVQLLPPASVIKIGRIGDRLKTRDFCYKPTLPAENFEDYVDTSYTLLDRAVQRRLRGRKKAATLLSGGLDSRIITAIVAKHSSTVDSFSFGYNTSCQEYTIARKVAKKIPGCTTELSRTDPEHIMEYLKWAVWVSDGNVSNFGYVSCFLGALVELVSAHDILLGGFVGDLIVGGSFTKEEDISINIPMRDRIEKMEFRVGVRRSKPFIKRLFTMKFADNLNYYASKSVEDEFADIARCIELYPFQQDLFVILTRCRKCYNTTRGLIGHAFIEEFYPFFDNDLFSFLYSLPPEVRMDHKLYIAVYKKYFPELARVPWLKTGVSLYDKKSAFAKRKERLMEYFRWHVKRRTHGRLNIIDGKKYGPENDWYRMNRKLREFIRGILLDPRTIARGYFREEGIEALLKELRTGWDYMFMVVRLCVFELWCRLFLDDDEKPVFPV